MSFLKSFRSVVHCFLLLCVLLPPGFSLSRAADQPVAAVAEVKTFPGVAEVVPRGTQVSDQAASAQQLIEDASNDKPWQEGLEKVRQRQQALQQRIDELGAMSGWSFERLLEMRTLLQEQKNSLGDLFNSISKQSAGLDQLRTSWLEQRAFWKEWESQLGQLKTPYPKDVFKTVLQTCDDLLKQAVKVNETKIALQKKVTEIGDSNQSVLRQIDVAIKDLRSSTFKKTASSLFSARYYQQYNEDLAAQVKNGFSLVSWYNPSQIAEAWWILLLKAVVVLFLFSTIRHYRGRAQDSSEWRFLIRHPLASGLFVAMITLSGLYTAPTMLWQFYLALIAVSSATLLVSDIVPARRHRLLVWLLAGGYLLSLFFQVISLPLPLFRLYLVLISLTGLPLLKRICVLSRCHRDHWLLAAGIRALMAILLISLIAQAGGYSTLSSRLIDATFKSVFLVLMSVMILKLARGGTDFLLAHKKLHSWHFFRRFGSELGQRVKKLELAVIVVYGLLYLVQIWGGSDSLASTWTRVGAWGIQLSDIHINLHTLLSIALILYLSFTLSWMLRSLLDVEIIGPKYIDKGARDSIKTLLHYTIVLCALLMCFSAAGASLENFAVIAGALSIGIGFGLQNVVNNFISGLILLFERPIKKGDVIILDGEWAVVQKIGLRSTVVETYNKSEMIVPNGDLIAQKVTNLTHSNSEARLVIAVGTAYGSNMEQVLSILQQEAQRHPLVLADPAPSAIFTGFGNSSLDFELRVWLDNPEYVLKVRSEVSIAIYNRFAVEKIEIPFPQNDLHVRSVDGKVLEQWQLACGQTLKPAAAAKQQDK
ncbi:MAG: mechanosensitive ion channel [Desulfuromonadaceae bacterium]|nr:mechanosensitive ion channel [Desulfuromonadaceae bacterium]